MTEKLHTGKPPVDLGYFGKTVERFWEKVDRSGDCWVWEGTRNAVDISGNQYGVFGIQVNKKSVSVRAHRLAWLLTNGSIPGGKVIRHRCDNTLCVNPAHLEPGSQGDNVRDAIRRGRALNGKLNGRAKLTEEDVIRIRGSNRSTSELASEFGVHPTTIWSARNGRKWKSLRLPDDDWDSAD